MKSKKVKTSYKIKCLSEIRDREYDVVGYIKLKDRHICDSPIKRKEIKNSVCG